MKTIFHSLILLFLISSLVPAQSKTTPSTPTVFMPVSEVRAGMKGTARTVFSGTEPKPFDVEILGVATGMIGPQQDMIIGRISGGEADRTFVFAGMSGSPVYIDGKLVGSVSFAFPFSKEAICGITPIEQIVSNFRDGDADKEKGRTTFSFSELSAKELSAKPNYLITGTVPANLDARLAAMTGQTFRPIAVPLSFNGISQKTLDLFTPQLMAAGLVPVAAAGGAAPISDLKKSDAQTLTGGTSVTMQLARGDFSISAAGTVTWRDGEKIYAFGHPFLGLGSTELPMAESSVITVIPNLNNSFKIAVPEAMVGTMTQDRQTGVYGKLGVSPRMIPVKIDFTNSRGVRNTFRFEVVKDEFLTPLLINIGTANTLLSSERNLGETTVAVKGRIEVKGQNPIVIDRRFGGMQASAMSSLSIALPVNALLQSKYSDTEISGINVEMRVEDGSSIASFDRVTASRTEVKAGETIELTAYLRGDGGRVYQQKIPVKIPDNAPAGAVTITVADGGDIQQSSVVQQFTPRSLSDLIHIINSAKKDDRLYVQISRVASGAVIGASEMPNLPPSVLATLGSDRSSGGYKTTTQFVLLEQELAPAEFILNGKQTLVIQIVR